MRVTFAKITNDRHALEIERLDGSRERVEVETKSILLHDFLHWAVEAEAGLTAGFWGRLASGTTLADMNDRTGKGIMGGQEQMQTIEMLVGALTPAAKGAEPEAVIARLRSAIGSNYSLPGWLTPDFVRRVQERPRHLLGLWQATLFGAKMEIVWKDS